MIYAEDKSNKNDEGLKEMGGAKVYIRIRLSKHNPTVTMISGRHQVTINQINEEEMMKEQKSINVIECTETNKHIAKYFDNSNNQQLYSINKETNKLVERDVKNVLGDFT